MSQGPTKEQHEKVAQAIIRDMSEDNRAQLEDLIADDLVTDKPFPIREWPMKTAHQNWKRAAAVKIAESRSVRRFSYVPACLAAV